jgi:hypothetical protein
MLVPDLGSRIQIFSIPDPGSRGKKYLDPGSGISFAPLPLDPSGSGNDNFTVMKFMDYAIVILL